MLLVITGVIYLCPALPEIAVTFLVESFKSVLERLSSVSCINFIELFRPSSLFVLSLQMLMFTRKSVDCFACCL